MVELTDNNSMAELKTICFGCITSDETCLYEYKVQTEILKGILQMEHVCLCHLCKRIAQKAELFIQTVQNNQKLLENIDNISNAELENIRALNPSIIKLAHFPQNPINIISEGINEVMYNFNKYVKMEMKQEDGEWEKDCDEFVENDSGTTRPPMKQEEQVNEQNVLNITQSTHLEIQIEVEPISVRKRRQAVARLKIHEEEERCDDDSTEVKKVDSKSKFKQKHLNKKPLKRKQLRNLLNPIVTRITSDEEQEDAIEVAKVEMVNITREQCIEEREKMMLDEKYINSIYKCEHCIKGFNLKESYDTHMKKHSKEMGEYECDICKQRMDSDDKLQTHKKCHKIRYKCGECGFTRISHTTIKDHYAATHFTGKYQYKCPHCLKDFNREITLRKHVSYAHRKRERVTCDYCRKTFGSRDALKTHLVRYHPKEVSAQERQKNYICKDCGLKYASPSALKVHSVRHSDRRDYYCVECDKSFKTDSCLKKHLTTTSAHISNVELPLPCQYCEKRFAVRRNLERHINKVHLQVKPTLMYQCDKCDKAYVNDCSLTVHKRQVHEGYRPPLKYKCPMCDKAFNQNRILKNHIRTHTGERPYQCRHCPATFSQASILGTHVKLIHLKLTRDGKPKAQIK